MCVCAAILWNYYSRFNIFHNTHTLTNTQSHREPHTHTHTHTQQVYSAPRYQWQRAVAHNQSRSIFHSSVDSCTSNPTPNAATMDAAATAQNGQQQQQQNAAAADAYVSPYPDDLTMGEVDYSNLPYIISLFVLILSLRKCNIKPVVMCVKLQTRSRPRRNLRLCDCVYAYMCLRVIRRVYAKCLYTYQPHTHTHLNMFTFSMSNNNKHVIY